ncbi:MULTISPECIES: ABC transporter substrate-binding protein [Nitrincola]|uniref:ABC transporter, substrate binding protein, PQQ-dependent alcohol dehydrogenase system n=1 Tax=Nitrincola nitratireducens TaxID=1229521 RepID=W9VJY7_9GAMM|nr:MULTISPECIES: ABC transporter substrate-binding protein [Nitrincola]EXJ10860.1 ABC transporter, substrate binding protein, PQQ-dependent alcohol dehydrogenase system [Nitrincola nitratireducens]
MKTIKKLITAPVTACLLASAIALSTPAHSEGLEVRIAYLGFEEDKGPLLSNSFPEPEDSGLKGAEVALRDNNSTGRFLKQTYHLDALHTDDADELYEFATQLHADGVRFFVANLPADQIRRLHETFGDDALLFNAGSKDDALRVNECIPGLLHTLPSRAMLADALGQWLAARRWNKWLLVTGQTEDDKAYAAAIRRAADRFGGRIVAEKEWDFDTDLRRTAQQELPMFTRASDYDVVIVADERGDFGEYLLYNTWLPRPVAGTQGLMPTGWHKAVEAWGAAQLHSRFERHADRWMNELDYASWAGVRTVGEAVAAIKTTELKDVRAFILSDDFQLAGFKGRRLEYRPWSGQLKQPIPLVHPRALVSQSPQEGFLHPVTDLDTLGFDAPESQCHVK